VRPADPADAPDSVAAVEGLRAKYPQYREVAVLRDPPILLELRVRSVSGWCAGAGALAAVSGWLNEAPGSEAPSAG
jgi:hypothetical protein